MKKRLWQTHALGILLLGNVMAYFAWADTSEFVTYYPTATSTTFDRAHANRMTIGTPYQPSTVPTTLVPDGTLLVSGKIGLGTTAPATAKMVVVGFVTDANNNNIVSRFESGQTNSTLQVAGTTGSAFFGTDTQGDVFLGSYTPGRNLRLLIAGGPEPMRITASGNVGVGTTGPSTNLHVKGTTDVATLQASNVAGAKFLSFDYADGGTSDYGNFQIQPSTLVLQAGNFNGKLQLTPYNGGIYNSNLGLIVNPSGNVGIGTASPSYPLAVRSSSTNAVYGNTSASGAYGGYFEGNTNGVLGSASTYGVVGYASSSGGIASYAYNTGAGSYGGLGWSSVGVYGHGASNWSGIFAGDYYGAYGYGYYYGLYGQNAYYWTPAVFAYNGGSGYWAYIGYGYYGMYTNGYVTAAAFTYYSSLDRKKDISVLSPAEELSMLQSIDNLPLVRYRFKEEQEEHPQRLGLIAEWSPQEIKPLDGKQIDVGSYVTYSLAGIKSLSNQVKKQQELIENQQRDLQELKKELTRLKTK